MRRGMRRGYAAGATTSGSQNASPEHKRVCAGYAPGVCGGPVPEYGPPRAPPGPKKPTGYAPRVCGAYIYIYIYIYIYGQLPKIT